MAVTAGQLQEITGCSNELAAEYAPLISYYAQQYNVDELPMFIAQVAHESGRFKATVENLNYSAAALIATWPSRYDAVKAQEHHRKPELIANWVYSWRMGNNANGDGWNYRGRGLIQLTGKANYRAFQIDSGKPVLANPEMLEDSCGAVESACWFWEKNVAGRYKTVRECTRIINGGYNGLADREALYAKAVKVLSWS